MHKEGVLEEAKKLLSKLKSAGIRVKLDDSDRSPGFKFSESEMRGIPVRLEIGPKDIEKNQCIVVRRDNFEKQPVGLDNIDVDIKRILENIQKNMYETALKHRDSHTYTALNMEEFEEIINTKPGFIKAMYCGNQDCEDEIKDRTGATARCIPFKQEEISKVCVCCKKPAKQMIYWGRAY